MKEKDVIDELTRANRELIALYDINRLLQTPLTTEEKLYIILTSLTATDGFGYSRAYLLLMNKQKNTLEGWLGVGPLTGDEARELWEGVTALEEEEGDTAPGQKNIADILDRTPFDYNVRSFSAPVKRGQGHPVQTVVGRRPKLLKDLPLDSDQINSDFAGLLSSSEAAFIPLLSKKRVMGVIVVESNGGDRHIDEGRLRSLTIFGNLAAIALENAELYRALEDKVNCLELNNRELQEAQAKILHLDRLSSMGAIAAGVAHEIKNPLNSLIINLELLKAELPCGNPEVVKLVNILEDESIRLNETVTEFLSYAKAPKLSLANAHLHRVLDSVLELVEYQGISMGIKIEKDYDASVTDALMDDKRMKQAFLNVIINAMQAMPSGGCLTVKTALHKTDLAAEEGGHIVIEFRDTGHGIPAECIDRLFDPFFTTKDEGTGIGLPIVDSILRSHGGRVSVESRQGKGTSIYLNLPAITAVTVKTFNGTVQ